MWFPVGMWDGMRVAVDSENFTVNGQFKDFFNRDCYGYYKRVTRALPNKEGVYFRSKVIFLYIVQM